MANRVVAFRVSEEDWEGFRRLVENSERNIQSVLREFISACLEVKSVEVKPVQRAFDGSDLSDELKLRDNLRRFRGYMEHGNYEGAKHFFGEVRLNLHGVENPVLLEEAQSLSLRYLKWIDEREKKTGGYESDDD